jgi:NADH:ubiquinone oxidoreductase subunit F (NADH-binding)/quercetin dioxygenase-like cupin family protein
MNYYLLPDLPYSTYESYLEKNGPSAVRKARSLNPQEIVDEIRASGLRGRGGAGFQAGVKWKTILDHSCPTRYVVCNAAEGEPGTFKDRYLLRKNPYSVLEGILIAAHVVGAKTVYIGIKASFDREIDRLNQAIHEMRTAGLISDIDIVISPGPGEYLFGEEKALLNQIESGLPLPREAHYPPYEKGLFATPESPNPALVNNVETFAHVPSIVRGGADGFRSLGTADTSGTVLYTISGDVERPGVYELNAGVSLRKLIYEAAGGPVNGDVKAVLSGFSAGMITGSELDTPADFGSLSALGSGLGSAGFIVLNSTRSMVRIAQTAARFLYVESCNQCPACKHGLGIASHTLDGMFDPEQSHVHSVELALFGARSAPQANRCYLPVQASILISSLVGKFKPEFDVQLTDPRRNAEPFPVPLITDFDEANHQFVYDERFAFKNPDWTYSVPAVVQEPLPSWRQLDFRHEIDELESTEFWKSEDRMAKTLVKEGSLRVVLTLMKAGAVLKKHKAEGTVTIQVLHGRIRVNVDDNTVELEQSQMMSLTPGVRHSVEALEKTALVISISSGL